MYVDINGNNVYDPGIDLFVMSVGADNMDYNDRGKHDGPLDRWEPLTAKTNANTPTAR